METDSPPLQPSPDLQSLQIRSEASPISPSSKGKAPMEEPSAPSGFNEDDSYPQPRNCGICLSEEGHAVRGRIDSCDHYFCFLCIVEWSKIESRCPLCKGRFGQIRRMRTDGSFLGDRAVIVPVRNQIYDLQGNMTSGPHDPYSNISCTVCTGSRDENLLLLCDLCDTAVHTYCAGLGATVPEDDWFCQECTQMKAEDLNRNSLSSDHSFEKAPAQVSCSIFDIVRGADEPDPEVSRLLTLFPPQVKQPEAICQNGGFADGQGSREIKVKVTASSVRTLNRCRDANKYIRDLRENWNALRSGSLSFPSRKFDSGVIRHSRMKESNCGNESNGSLRTDTSSKCSHDIEQAWKMFDIAKSKKTQKSSGTTSLKNSTNLFLGASRSVTAKPKSNTSAGLKMAQSFKRHNEYGSKESGLHNPGIKLGREKTTVNYASLVSASSGNCTSSSKKMQISIKNDASNERDIMSPKEKLGQRLPHVYQDQGFLGTSHLLCANLQKKPAASSTFQRQTSSESNQLRKSADKRVNTENIISESKRIKVACETTARESNQSKKSAMEKVNAETISSESKHVKVDIEAKTEIQSLVKLNLKILSAGNKLEVEMFKDIARRSTHEILAACGLEPSRRHKSYIPKPICSHGDQINTNHSKSSLMPNSCRECFYTFVKEVVGSILSDKISR